MNADILETKNFKKSSDKLQEIVNRLSKMENNVDISEIIKDREWAFRI